MSKINLLVLVPTLSSGGAERQLSYLLQNLDRSQYLSINLFVLRQVDFFKSEIPDDVNIYYGKNYKNIPIIISQLLDIIKNKKIDIVQTFLPTANFYGGIIKLIKGRKVKLITSQRGLHHKFLNKWTFYNLFAHRVADKIVANSETVKRNCMKFFKIREDKIKVIYNGFLDFLSNKNSKVDKDSFKKEFNLKGDLPIIVTVGRFDELKGHQTLFKIIKEALKVKKFYFFFIGNGPLKKRIEEMVKSEGLEEYIKFTGKVKNVFKFYSVAELFVLHTYSEGFSNVISEAMLYGLPVITTDIEANKELIKEGEDGIVVKVDEIDGFSKRILELLSNKKLRNFLGKNAKEKILKNFSIEKMVKSYEREYMEVLNKDEKIGKKI